MTKVIDSFKGEYSWLSNFAPCFVRYDNFSFPSVEHAYVYAKTAVPEEQQLVLESMSRLSAGKIKKLGKSLTLRDDWESVRLDIMRELTRWKYRFNPMRRKLILTDDAQLVEGNTWGDTFWGVCNGVGENHLGKIIMEVREEILSAPYTFTIEGEDLRKMHLWMAQNELKLLEKQSKSSDSFVASLTQMGDVYCGAIGGHYDYKFSPTSVGEIIEVYCHLSKESVKLDSNFG